MLLHSSRAASASRPARLRRLVLLLALLCLSALGRAASANTLTVPGQYATIQAAVTASASGDTVLISDGTYTGPGDVDLDFGGRNITVTSQNGAARTIIDCGGFSSGDGSGDHRGFRLHSGETSAVISGLTVKNGYESGNGSGDGQGGGIEALGGASVTVQNCALTGNTAGFGGGLYNGGSTVTLTNCALTGDTAAYYGGGLYNDTGTVGLTDCALEGDTAGYYGGGLYNDGGTVGLTDCALVGDTAGYYGGGLFNFGTVGLTDCALVGDTAGYYGGGLTGNTSRNYGGGVFNYGTVGLTDCTLTANTAPNGGGLYTGGGTATLTNDILYGDTGGEITNGQGALTASYCDVQGSYPGTNNLAADPLFVSPATGDVHLQAGSPCLGAGTPSGAPSTDKDGRVRPNPPSIGAYELGSTLTVPGQYATIQAAINASVDGDTVLISDGTYTGPGNVDLDFGGRNVTVTSVHGPATTIIDCGGFASNDGSGNHRGFWLHSGETNAVISGLTIKNGYENGQGSSDGFGGGIEIGGIYGGASVTVQNCVLLHDTATYGGGLYNDRGCTATLTDCALTGNTAKYSGGLFNEGTATLTGCALAGNGAQYYGGGLENVGTVTLTNCTLTGNTAPYGGGGLFNSNGNATLTNCTLAGNQAGGGGGLYNFGGTATLTNDILYGDAGGEIFNNGTATATHCDVAEALGSGGDGVSDGGGNLDADPMFASASDLHLLPVSPCRGAGTSSGAPTTTLDGYTRPSPPSIGAYELSPPAATTTTLTSSLNPSLSGQSVTFTAGVTGGTPTGSVTFTIDGSAQTPVTLDGSGHATLTPSPLSIGSHQITASYGGDANNAASTSSTLTQTVSPTFQVYAVNAQSPAGQTVLLSAGLNKPGGIGLSGVTLTFSVDGTAVGVGTTNKNGVASFHYALPLALSLGGHPITASFAGDGTNPASSGGSTLTVTAPRSTLLVGASSGVPGQSVTLSATLKRVSGGAALSGETVTFTVDGASVGTATTSASGLAALAYAIPAGDAAGAHPVAASFAGDGTYGASTGKGALSVKTATALSVSGVSGAHGTSVTLTATLSSGGVGVSGKTVTFKADGKAVGTAVTDASGVATLTYAIPATSKVGSHALGGLFAGDATDTPATGAGTLTVR